MADTTCLCCTARHLLTNGSIDYQYIVLSWRDWVAIGRKLSRLAALALLFANLFFQENIITISCYAKQRGELSSMFNDLHESNFLPIFLWVSGTTLFITIENGNNLVQSQIGTDFITIK